MSDEEDIFDEIRPGHPLSERALRYIKEIRIILTDDASELPDSERGLLLGVVTRLGAGGWPSLKQESWLLDIFARWKRGRYTQNLP
jgi:hypothetical protein